MLKSFETVLTNNATAIPKNGMDPNNTNDNVKFIRTERIIEPTNNNGAINTILIENPNVCAKL